MAHYDVVIVGTRCAGSPLAMLLARRGHRVLAFDRSRFPSDTISTHFMWPRTTSFLSKWGLLERLSQTGCPAIKKVTMDYGAAAICGRPSAADGIDVMYSPRRITLDQMLVEAAKEAGAEIWDGVTFRDLVWENGAVVGVQAQRDDGQKCELPAKMVVGADGLWSPVARAAGAATDMSHASLTCGYYAYWEGVPTDGVEFYVRDRRDILVFPTHEGHSCIWAGISHDGWRSYRGDIEGTYRSIIATAPGLAKRINSAKQVSPFKGTSKLPNFYRQSFGNGWALVGDAAYHRDPLTGMGIGDAFLGAQLLADALSRSLAGDASNLTTELSAYQASFRAKTRPVFDYTLKAASLKDPAATLPLYKKIAALPDETARMMDVLAGNITFKEFFNPDNISRLMARSI